MINIAFNFESNKVEIQADLEQKMIDVINKYIAKVSLDIEKIYFLYNGNFVEKELKVNQIINEVNRDSKSMSILVNLLEWKSNDNTTKQTLVISKEIICPICKSICIIKMKDYKIFLLHCKEKHKSNNIFLEEFEQTQQIDESQIKCENCNIDNRNKNESHNNIFFICLTCNINLCPMCRTSHDKAHNIINYDHKNFICKKHNSSYISYCKNCLLNICMICESEHNSHTIKHFSKIIPKKEDLIKKINEIRNLIDNFKNNIKEVTTKEIFDKIIGNLENYYKIYNNIINNYDTNFLNYELLSNLNDFIIDNSFINDLNDIISQDNNDKKKSKINTLNKKLCTRDIEEITLIYDASKRWGIRGYFKNVIKETVEKLKENEIRLFSSEFVEKNKDKCKIIYEGKEYELIDIFNHENINNDTKIIQFKLKGINNIVDMSNIFCQCRALKSLPDISFWDISKMINLSCIFKKCINLENVSDISNWDTSNVTNMDSIFAGCSSLTSLSDISNWNTSKVTNMKNIFNCCKSLTSLPDISKWDTSNVINMSGIFESCSELESLPDISKWNISKVNNISKMFKDCFELKSLPDIEKWKTSNIIDISELFSNCSSLESLPDITKWDNSNFKNIFALFSDCSSVSSLPDISN